MYYRRSADLLEAGLGDELVALDTAKGLCFGFNSPAASVWRELAMPRTFEHLQERLIEEFDVPKNRCASELVELLEDMTQRGLVELGH